MAVDRKLIVVIGKKKGEFFHLKKDLKIGRFPDNDIIFEESHVSRYHALIELKDDKVFLRDLSRNGTFLNFNRIDGVVELKHGDIIAIGLNSIRYVCPEATSYDEKAVPAEGHLYDDVAKSFSIKGIAVKTIEEEKDEFQALDAEEHKPDRMRDRLKALYHASQMIAEEQDPDQILSKVLDEAFNLIGTDNGAVLMFDSESGELNIKHTRSDKGKVKVCRTIVERSFDYNEAILAEDAPAMDEFQAAQSIHVLHITSVICAPIVHRQERLGVIYLDKRGGDAFNDADRECLVALSNTAALAVHNSRNMETLENMYKEAIETLARVIELRDKYTVGHAGRVSKIAVEVAKHMEWPEEELKWVKIGGLLHDIGKIIIDNTILNKDSYLTTEERDIMEKHPAYGADILKTSSYLKHLVPFCLYHHERFDGKGYPNGIKGEGIPLGARIIAVADVFDAITSERPYQSKRTSEQALAILEEEAGLQFDPQCVTALKRCIDKGVLNSIL